jgi:mannose-1-phosphate guanylyltransferase
MIRFVRESPSEKLWIVILAAGEGKRLSPLTRALYGREIPKQFAVLSGRRSLLQRTLERTLPLVPAERTLVVVPEAFAAIARAQTARYGGVELVLQPRNLDTGPGMLLPLVHVLARDPEATVAFVPSDHHFSRPAALRDALGKAAWACEHHPDQLVLLGASADSPEGEYGWILPGGPIGSNGTRELLAVRGFVEKPGADLAASLLREGAYWNTFITVARAATVRALAEDLLPDHAAAFAQYARSVGERDEAEALRRIYRSMSPSNFSRAILERTDRLGLLPLAGTSWCDLGTPERLIRILGPAATVQAALRSRFVLPSTLGWAGALIR